MMKRHRQISAAAGILLAALIFTAACTEQQPQQNVPPEKFCQSEADCAAAACCHPTDALNKAYAPDCSTALCSAECAPNTLDCLQGEIRCIRSACTAVIY